MFRSVLHPARQTQRSKRLGLAHQGHNGAGGGILDLSYSWGTMSMWLLHRDRLLAPNTIRPTNHTHVCVPLRENVHARTFGTGHKDSCARLRRESNHHHSNVIWVQSVPTAISFIKKVRYTSSSARCFWAAQHLPTREQSEGRMQEVCVIGVCLMTVLMVTYITTGAHSSLYL